MIMVSVPGIVAKRWSKATRKWAEDKRGLAIVEFALVAGPFFFLIFGLLEICMVFIMTSVMEHGASEASRLIRTGQFHSRDVIDEEQFRNEICNNAFGMLPCDSGKIRVDISRFTNFSGVTNSSPITNGNYDSSNFGVDIGNGGDIIVVRVFYEWSLITPILSRPLANVGNDKRLLQATVVFRNEPF